MAALRVNLGCGDRYAPGWWNVDRAEMPARVDQVVDLTGPLPWALDSIFEVYAGHVLEHLSEENAVDLLRRLLPLMQPRGAIMVVGPDLDLAEQMADADGGLGEYHSLDSLRHGAGRWAGDEHLWECTGRRVAEMLLEAGWRSIYQFPISQIRESWPVVDREPQWQCAVLGIRA